MLALERLFAGDNPGSIITSVLHERVLPPSTRVPGLPRELDGIVLRALASDRERRFESARATAQALESCVPVASPSRVSDWVQALVGDLLAERVHTVSEIESASLEDIQVERSGSMQQIAAERARSWSERSRIGCGRARWRRRRLRNAAWTRHVAAAECLEGLRQVFGRRLALRAHTGASRSRVHCASNSSACTGSPRRRRMTRLLKKGGSRAGASVAGSVGSPSQWR